jgi:hypothetical protein
LDSKSQPTLNGYLAEDALNALAEEPPELALFTTYTFTPAAFEEKYRRPLDRLGCHRVVVATDPIGLSQSLENSATATGIGTTYYLRPVTGWAAFHAKLVILPGRSRTVLGVGGGNLTASGLVANAEVSGLCVFPGAGPGIAPGRSWGRFPGGFGPVSWSWDRSRRAAPLRPCRTRRASAT